MDALLAAYRVGARVAWREMSTAAVERGLPAETVAQFAELVFAYIDELSAASVAGHTDELATSGRVRQQYRERLAQALLAGATAEVLLVARRAGRLGAAGGADRRTAAERPDARTPWRCSTPATLSVPGDLAGADRDRRAARHPIPGARCCASCAGRSAVVGPARGWSAAASSYARAVRLQHLAAGASSTPRST